MEKLEGHYSILTLARSYYNCLLKNKEMLTIKSTIQRKLLFIFNKIKYLLLSKMGFLFSSQWPCFELVVGLLFSSKLFGETWESGKQILKKNLEQDLSKWTRRVFVIQKITAGTIVTRWLISHAADVPVKLSSLAGFRSVTTSSAEMRQDTGWRWTVDVVNSRSGTS